MKKIIFINFIAIVLIILVLELIIKHFQLSDLMGIEGEKLYNLESSHYKFKSNAEGLVFNEMIYTETNGFRAPYQNFKYDNQKKSVIFFGDSVTFGNGVEESKTFVGLLRIKYKNYNFYNISLPGYQINDHLKNLSYLDNINNIDKIFYVYTLNDILIDQNIEKFNFSDNKNFNLIDNLKKIKTIYYLNTWLISKSYLYMYLRGKFTDPSSRWFKYDYNLYYNEILLKNLNKNFNELKNNLLNKNREIIVIILPYEYQTRNNQCSDEISLPQNKIIEILKKEDIKYYNLLKMFCKQEEKKHFFYKFDPMHLSIKGHFLVFKFLDELFN